MSTSSPTQVRSRRSVISPGRTATGFIRMTFATERRLLAIVAAERPDAVIHLAAESHVDRSIDGAGAFIETNIVGTYSLLEAAADYWASLDDRRKAAFRFLHVSTDEVFGALGDDGAFTEETAYVAAIPLCGIKASAIISCALGIILTACRR